MLVLLLLNGFSFLVIFQENKQIMQEKITDAELECKGTSSLLQKDDEFLKSFDVCPLKGGFLHKNIVEALC